MSEPVVNPFRALMVPPGEVSPHAGLVLYRGLHGDTVAILVSHTPAGATLIVLDRCMAAPPQAPALTLTPPPPELLVLGRVERGVARGDGDGTAARPNWHPLAAQLT